MTEAAALPARPARWLLVTAAATLGPHAIHLPFWLLVACGVLLGWSGTLLYRKKGPPRRFTLLLLAMAAGLAVKTHYGQFFGMNPGVALLAILLCLKMLELRTARDLYAAVLLSFFLQVGLFLFEQTPAVAAAVLAATVFATMTLLSLHDRSAPAASLLRSASLLLAQGLPFMLVLFVLFPRVQGPLWGLPSDAYSGLTGLSDSMTPGSISRLGESTAIAFRAQFSGPPPPPAQRYWRGPVLTRFDGTQWTATPSTTASSPAYSPSGARYDYELTLEPHNRNWLLALDFPDGGTPGARYASDYRLLANVPLRERRRLDLRAYPETPVGAEEDAAVLDAALLLPPASNPRTVALARQLTEDAPPPEVVLARVIGFLEAASLDYTLRPPLLGQHSVDEFLFDTRRGFCEHFASAFVFLLRAAGVPARVVLGYQGGELNPVDGSLVIRQSDAHAWAETWLPGRGWVRVDPTGLVAPSRIESGLGAALPAGEPLPFMLRPDFAWLRHLRHRWEALSNGWDRWVLGYNPTRQQELLRQLGFPEPDWRTLASLLAANAGALALLLLGWAYTKRRSADPLDRAWDVFCRKLARRGTPRDPWEGPLHYGRRVAAAFPEHAPALQEIAARYARLRYGSRCEPGSVRDLAQRIRRLKLK